MILPTEDQIDRAAAMLKRIRDDGNRRPGDNHIDHDIAIQLRVRAMDMLVVMLNQKEILGG